RAAHRQRPTVPRAPPPAPAVLLLDEPTASLDPRQRRLLWEVAAQVRERQGAVVFATQNLEALARFATRVAVLVGGELVFDGSLEQFKASPEADVFAGGASAFPSGRTCGSSAARPSSSPRSSSIRSSSRRSSAR